MSRDTGFKLVKRESKYNFLKWGEYMKRAQNAEIKVAKLKQLILLTDPCVSSEQMGPLQIKQWSEFIKQFPEETK